MLSIVKLLFVASSATAIIIPRTYTSAQGNLTVLERTADDITARAGQLTGNTATGTHPVYAAEGYLLNNFTAAINDLNNYPTTFSSAQSSSFLAELSGTFYPKLRAALNGVVVKKRNFEADEIRSLQTLVLNAVSTKATSYGGAFVTKVPAPQRASATLISASFSSLVASAVSAYSAAPTA